MFCFVERFYVNFVLVNNYEKEVLVRSQLDHPYDNITLPAGARPTLSIQTRDSNGIVFSVIDPRTGQRLKINNKTSELITPTITKSQPVIFYLPVKGKPLTL